MKEYPFSPEVLDALPEELAELFRNLELTLLEEICSRLKLKDNLNEVTVQDIRALRSHGVPLDEIEKAIKKATGVSQTKLNQLMDDVVERNQQYYSKLIDFVGITQPQTLVDAVTVDAIRRQTAEEFRNITRSLGFLVDSGQTKLEPADAYQWALDNALLQIDSGAINYNEAIKNAVKQLADSGIRVVEHESGHVDYADVAARRAVMTGVSQLCAKYTEQSAEYLGTDFFEVSAHIGARDVPGPSPWSSHKDWQGKVYSVRAGDKYPNIYAVCGLGYVDGLEGANCRHIRFPFVDGVSERTYTDEELKHIDDGHDFVYEGKHYSAYEATQKQRQIERTMRKLEREETAYKAANLKEDATAVSVKRKRLMKKYRDFSKAAGLPEQPERTKVISKTTVDSRRNNGIINTKLVSRKITHTGEVINPMDEQEYNVMKASLERQGVDVFAAIEGDDLRYMVQALQSEGIYSDGRITHVGRIPSRGTFLEEIIHWRQAVQYGELTSTDFVERCAREIEANRKLLKYKKQYRLDELDIADIERNLPLWEANFKKLMGVSYDESNYRGNV